MPEGRNRLGAEQSPYLLQHKDNPVWWHAWGEEAFAEARRRDVPVFLSIGYSTCHWCHVMEHESFEDEEVARALNEGFVAIKLDREERPDVDAIYMDVVQGLTGHGGWPMSVWLTPEGKPFFGGTYFPRAAFLEILGRIGAAWRTQRADLDAQGRALADAVARKTQEERAGALDESVLRGFLSAWRQRYDARNGGIGGAPKFPHAYDLQLLLRIHRRTGAADAIAMVRGTLDAMARGGMVDHLAGGFHRYSVDAAWGVPHFEKMLYDQASLSLAYLEAFEVTGESEYELVARETLDYVLRDLTHPEGAFYSAEDADSEGEEGKFYVFTAAELREILEPSAFHAFTTAFGITEAGNWEGSVNIPRLAAGQSRAERTAALSAAIDTVRAHRNARERPHLDDKVLTDWNGLMIASMARAGRALGEPRYVEGAARAARFLLTHLRREDGGLWHRWRDGDAGIPGFLDDHAFLIHGLIELYAADFDPEWLEAAAALQAVQERRFRNEAEGDYYLTDGSDPLAIARRVEPFDNVVPAGRSVAALNALRLGDLLVDRSIAIRAKSIFDATPRTVRRLPIVFSQLLIALDYALDRSREIAVVGPLDAPETRRLLSALTRGFRPNQVVAAGPSGSRVPLLRGRLQKDGRATAYVCENQVCRLPTADVDEAVRLAADVSRYDPPSD